jgi:putative hemolysin
MEIDQFLPRLMVLGLLLFFSGFFSGSETALCALTQVQIERIRNEKRKTSLAIINFVDNHRRLFITILLGNTFINTAFATITYSIIRHLSFFESLPEMAKFVIGTVIITLPLLLFGEITPKTYAIKYAETFSRITARPLWLFSVLISPLRKVLRGITDLLMPLFGGGDTPKAEHLTAEDFKAIVGTYEGEALQEDEREILGNILELRTIDAKEIMVPRTEMVAVEISAVIQEVVDKAKAVGLSRLPVYRRQIDNICGVFHVKDLPRWRHAKIRNLTIEDFLTKRYLLGGAQSADTLVRQPFFVLETKKIADLLSDLTQEKTHLAILLDEYGGVSGIVTIEDIIEEVVGDIFDEHDNSLQTPDVIVHPDNPSVIEVMSRVSVRQINQRFRLKIDEEIADTIGGYVFGLFGRVPSVGESQVDEHGIRFEVVVVERNFIGAVIMTLPPSDESVEARG